MPTATRNVRRALMALLLSLASAPGTRDSSVRMRPARLRVKRAVPMAPLRHSALRTYGTGHGRQSADPTRCTSRPGRRIVWKAVDGAPFDLEVALGLEPIGPTSTKATYGADIRLHGLWRLLSPMVAMEGKAGPARELQRLKTHVEAASVIAAARS